MTANDKAWALIFDSLPILEVTADGGCFDITATQIKDIGGREARLMCKFDFEQKVAKPFKDNELSILAISNGIYRIAKTRPFLDVDLKQIGEADVENLSLPSYLETLEYDNVTNESQALDAALASGMIDTLLGETSYLTVRGRRYSGKYDLHISSSDNLGVVSYPISSVQFEVDGGYEGQTKLALIEAKMGAADNMNLRQLIYPHVHFSNTIKKDVATYILFYEKGGIFTFIPLVYEGGLASLNYDLVKRFQLSAEVAPIPDVRITKGIINYEAPSPQANDFDKVLFGMAKLSELQPTSKEELFSDFAIHPRQYDYYFNAMRWLGIADRHSVGTCHLTKTGEDLLGVSEARRIGFLREIMMTDPIFSSLLIDEDYVPSEDELVDWKISEDTFVKRRRSTAKAWLKATETSNRQI